MRSVAFRLAGMACVGVMLSLALTAAPATAWVEENEFPLAVTFTDTPAGMALGRDGLIYVVSDTENSVNAFRLDPRTSNLTLVKTLKGPKTGLVRPKAVAFDSTDRMYVISAVGISVFVKDWPSGDMAPVRQAGTAAAGLSEPTAIAFDSVNRMYVVSGAETRGGAGSVTVYAENWGDVGGAPLTALTGPSTGLDYPTGIAFDKVGYMYVANRQTVTAYPLGWLGGDMAPIATLRGTATRLSRPMAISFDDDGYMVVANRSGFPTGSLEFFPPDWARGNTGRPTAEVAQIAAAGIPPTASVTGLGTQLNAPVALVLTGDGRIVAGNQRTKTLTVYQPRLQMVTVEGTTGTFLNTRFVDFAASASSGLSVSVIVATPKICRLVEGRPRTVELLNVGICIVEVSQLGDDDWARAPVVKHTITASPSPQTINWTLPSSLSLAAGAVDLSAKATSGLPVFWVSATPKVCQTLGPFGKRLKLLTVGTCGVTVYQPGNANWQPAPSVSLTTRVTKPRGSASN